MKHKTTYVKSLLTVLFLALVSTSVSFAADDLANRLNFLVSKKKQLCDAIGTRDSAEVQRLLKDGVNPDVLCGDIPALTYAFDRFSPYVMESDWVPQAFIEEAGANINKTDKRGNTPLISLVVHFVE